MKFTSVILFFFALSLHLSAQLSVQPSSSSIDLSVSNSTTMGMEIQSNIGTLNFKTVKTPQGEFNVFDIENSIMSGLPGSPAIPVCNRLIQVPENATVSIEVSESQYTDYPLSDLTGNAYQLMPFQPSVSKGQSEPVQLIYNATAYQTNSFVNPQRVNSEIKGHMRHLRMATLSISPIDYNPVTRVVRVYHSMKIKVTFPGGNSALTSDKARQFSGFMFSSAENMLMNHDAFSGQKDSETTYPVKYVIVADTMFSDQLKPFVDWKTKKGFIVVQAYTSNAAVGNTTTSIKSYLQNMYDNATPTDPAPSFILIAGDVAQVPAFSGTAGSHVTDMYYAEFTGDMIADAFIGRFSAISADQMQPQIDKTLEYEQYLFPQESWLDTVVMIGGMDDSFGATHANGQINYGTTYYFNASQGLYSYTHLYPNSGNEDALILDEIGEGVAFANYTAHGYTDGWADPTFDKSDISSMNNAHQYPLMIGNACVTNSFQQTECFGEALLRANLKGAVGYIGGSNNTYWNEDFYWGVGVRSTINANPTYDANNMGSYDRLWHITGEPFSEWYVSQGQMVLAGNLAVLQGGSSFNYYSEIYHLMGDPSLMIYLGVPSQLSVTHPALVPLGQSSIAVTTEPYAYVGISQNGVWHGAGIADASGNLTIDIIPFTIPGVADIVGTKQFRKPYVSTFIVQSPTGPYVLYNNKTVNDVAGNSNQQADFMETIDLNVNLKNYGLQNDSTVYAILSTNDPAVEIIDSVGIWGLIETMDTLLLNGAYTVKMDTLIQDQHNVPFNLSIRDSSGNQWSSTFNLKVNAPALEVLNLTIDDAATGNGNGKLDPGENVDLKISVVNSGHADVWNAAAILSSSSSYITINSANWQHDSLFMGVNETGTYNITVDNLTPSGTPASFTLDLEAMHFTDSKTFIKSIGLVDEDWESGDMTQYSWLSEGDVPWIITSGNPYEGAFGAQSGDITDDQTSELTIYINVLSSDTLSFFKKVSCEEGYVGTLWDGLDFQVDGTSKGQWGGEIDWSREAFLLSTGVQKLSWVYFKDGSLSSGSDAAWVDYIVFPPMQVVTDVNNDLPISNEMTVFPNPASGDLITVSAPVSAGAVSLSVYAADGRLVFDQDFNVTDGIIYLPIEINSWNSGIYTVALTSSNEYICKPLVVIHK